MYHVPHHACHPSRMGTPAKGSGSGCLILVIIAICIIALLGQCGKKDYTYNSDTNNGFPTGRTDNTTNSYTAYADHVPKSVEIESDSSGYSLIDYMATKPKPKELSLYEIIPESTETSQGKREDTR